MEFNFLSTKEAAIKHGVTERWIQQLCKDGKIEGARRLGKTGVWLIPEGWKKDNKKKSMRCTMVENVMVIDAKTLNTICGENSDAVIPVEKNDFLKMIDKEHKFLPRDIVEVDRAYKQIVSYCLIVNEDNVYLTRRTPKQTEKRLHNRFSVGIGGHINLVDCKSTDILTAGMLRELFEEVDIRCEYSFDFYGIINDNSTEVNSVHTGACYIIRLKKRDCTIKETEKMTGLWINKDEINKYIDNMEGWSKIFISSYFGVN